MWGRVCYPEGEVVGRRPHGLSLFERWLTVGGENKWLRRGGAWRKLERTICTGRRTKMQGPASEEEKKVMEEELVTSPIGTSFAWLPLSLIDDPVNPPLYLSMGRDPGILSGLIIKCSSPSVPGPGPGEHAHICRCCQSLAAQPTTSHGRPEYFKYRQNKVSSSRPRMHTTDDHR